MRSARDRGARSRSRPTESAPLGAPLFVLNLKSFSTALGANAERIGRELERSGRRFKVAVAIAPSPLDVGRLARVLTIPVLAQHADPRDAGPHTGFVPPESIQASGGRGSLVNHSEHPLSIQDVREVVRLLRERELVPIVCAKDVADSRRLAAVRPAYLAVEPPELIGGHRSVSTAKPEVVAGAVLAVRKVSPRTRVLCGAGVHDRHDVRRALELGSEGVLVASAVTKARDPKAAIEELLLGFR